MMKKFKRALLMFLMMTFLVGCSSDIREISDIALVMLTAIDYDKEKQMFIFTINCIDASTNSSGNSDKKLEWVATSSGKSIFEAARNLRSRAGKVLVWQHDKFFLIGESAARNSIYEIVDFMTRTRDIRLSSYVIISQGNASEMMRTKAETQDLISNEMVGKIKNEHLWGKSLSITVKDLVNYYTNPYRGFVTGRLSKMKPIGSSREVVLLSGGSVIQQGRLTQWISGTDVLSIHIIVNKKYWRDLEFSEYVSYKSANLGMRMKVSKRSMALIQEEGKPLIVIKIGLIGSITSLDKYLNLPDPVTLQAIEKSSSRQIEQRIKDSLNRFQHDLKVDVIGFSDFISKYHPNEWRGMEKTWITDIYPKIPIRVHVDVKIPTVGMSQVLGGVK
ncbi:Ger(x)C family spore germination protein [Paenibacillus sp. CGMCC 1.16610]|uniref:Ger(X)C family spore germination protein n=1 Tax=Paenibacillus anseongense TaxID=2682845 RepID=A0ABW9UGZ0_9BACL|nr:MULTISPECIES: Ger(x)C family spore germination protein [Paenibacillus]MBA2939769.1 Ger(x)C family spore germination protein [Paenibacillus sp. CGMCC 1.16610]MVQ39429.1 Ger(x)C family spore germination protein [Paenibacillus anseongense]